MRFTIFDGHIIRNVLQGLSIVVLSIFGWRKEGNMPDIPKFVLIAAPHTSNWDFPIGMAVMLAFKLEFNWLGKDSLFRWPFGGFYKWFGGIPINRSESGDVVAQSVRAFKDKGKMVLVVAPEGTRKKAKYWKTGFYHIANGANIPIVMGFLDYVRKVGGFGPTLMPTGDIEFDMKSIHDFYATVTGKYPEKSASAMIASKNG
jgi:1-acyl-sn-glycerol-3-phosphate acyltransferase